MTTLERARRRTHVTSASGGHHRGAQHRAYRDEVDDRLLAEYAGTVPAGRVIATLARAARTLAHVDADASTWVRRYEAAVRHALDTTAATPAPSAP